MTTTTAAGNTVTTPGAVRNGATLMAAGIEPGVAEDLLVDAAALREGVRGKYRDVALQPGAGFHFHTGRLLARRLGYDSAVVDALPDRAVASFAGVGNPFALRRLQPGEQVVDVGAGGGFDAFIAAAQVSAQGRVVGVDMTPEMLDKARATAGLLGLEQVEFRRGLAEALPIADQWADTVISNGVINLCADKRAVFAEIWRVLKPGGWLQFADIANGRPVPAVSLRDIDLWTGWIAGGLPRTGWRRLLQERGFVRVRIGSAVDTFGGAAGEANARRFDVYGYAFLARKPSWPGYKSDLMAGAELNGTVPLWQWIGDDGATTFSY